MGFRTFCTAWMLVFIACTPRTSFAQEILTLQKALQIALENNYAVKMARNAELQTINNAEGLLGIGNAGMLPNVNLTGAFTEGRNNVTQRRQGLTEDTQLNNVLRDVITGSVQFDWTLFDGLGMFATLDRLKAQEQRGLYGTQLSMETTIAQVMRSYYDVVQQQASLRALQTALDVSRERLKISEARQDIGQGSRLEVLRAQVDFFADSALVLRQAILVRNAKTALHVLLTRKSDDATVDALQIRDSIAVRGAISRSSYTELRRVMESNNITLQDARSAQTVADAAVREASAVFYPTLNASASYNYSDIRDQASIFTTNRLNGLNYGLNLQWNIFNGFNNSRLAQNASIDALSAQLAYSDVLMRLEGDLARAHRSLQNSLTIMRLQEENLKIAQETERLGLERFRIGALTSIELREIQQNALLAETQLIFTKFEAKASEIDVLRLTGQLISSNAR
jgi:outer membrane protein TolC